MSKLLLRIAVIVNLVCNDIVELFSKCHVPQVKFVIRVVALLNFVKTLKQVRLHIEFGDINNNEQSEYMMTKTILKSNYSSNLQIN